MGPLSALLSPVLARIGGAAANVIERELVGVASQYGYAVRPEYLHELCWKLAGKQRAEQEHILEMEQRAGRLHAALVTPGSSLGTGPIESPSRPHPAGQPAVSPGEAVFRQVAANDVDRDQREAALAPTPAPLPLAWAYPSALGMTGSGGVGMAGSVPGEPDNWTKAKYVMFGVVGSGIVVCVIYTFVRAVGWIIERLYYPPGVSA